jgi:hypothetical protein
MDRDHGRFQPELLPLFIYAALHPVTEKNRPDLPLPRSAVFAIEVPDSRRFNHKPPFHERWIGATGGLLQGRIPRQIRNQSQGGYHPILPGKQRNFAIVA